MFNYFIKSPETEKEWEEYLLFRWEILRKPLGMSKESLEDSLEDSSFHLMGIDDENRVIASGRIHFNESDEAQIRYMAVKDSFKRKGVGSEIVAKLEKYAISKGAKIMVLNARENALSFYLSLGYQEKGPYQSDTGIPHSKMEKSLIS
ncbi:MAG: histone acetyltransferase [Gammaproteobacteria bacterium]|jgi:predicted GNAT family N-acyltransferase|nr:histone acetyltransferase [Gammaproteobacteria bacterium]HJL95689.1 GNAT family N-acetyltransferase [SAR86 cluster bacterium]|tara:strand:+ start:6277 stop:6720 length:444 start_codon:yes stop_codon:yes gene_type:complete